MIVVDASAVVEALLAGGDRAALRTRLSSEDLHAPGLIDYEVVSAVRRLTLAERLSEARAREILADFDDLPITRWPFGSAMRRRALDLRHSVSSYDAAYVVLAEALVSPVVTRDARLARASGHDAVIEVL